MGEAAQTGSTLNIRNEADQSAPLGIATTRYEDRIATALLGAGHANAEFKEHEALCGAGLLFLLPALLAQGLLKTKEVYHFPHRIPPANYILTAATRSRSFAQKSKCKIARNYGSKNLL